jgi:hypothetical protein
MKRILDPCRMNHDSNLSLRIPITFLGHDATRVYDQLIFRPRGIQLNIIKKIDKLHHQIIHDAS